MNTNRRSVPTLKLTLTPTPPQAKANRLWIAAGLVLAALQALTAKRS